MDTSIQKELFSKAFVTAISAQAGFNHSQPVVDDDSIDLVFSGRDFAGPIRNPHIDVQLKCTSSPKCRNGVFRFNLSVKNYNDLRDKRVANPRYLFLVVVPDEISSWIEHIISDQLIVRQCAYWVSLKGMAATTNDKTITIDVPVHQVLRRDSLENLLLLASKR